MRLPSSQIVPPSQAHLTLAQRPSLGSAPRALQHLDRALIDGAARTAHGRMMDTYRRASRVAARGA